MTIGANYDEKTVSPTLSASHDSRREASSAASVPAKQLSSSRLVTGIQRRQQRTAEDVIALQGAVGNRRVADLMESKRKDAGSAVGYAAPVGAPAAVTPLSMAEEFERRICEQLAKAGNHLMKSNSEAAFETPASRLVVTLLHAQINNPVTRPRTLKGKEKDAEFWGFAKSETLFPQIYEQEFVDKLKALDGDAKLELQTEIYVRALNIVGRSMGRKADLTSSEIRDEFEQISERVKGLIDLGNSNYLGLRTRLLEQFGSPNYAAATIKVLNKYYDELQKCIFLTKTIWVHKDMKAALDRAHDKLKNMQEYNEIAKSVFGIGPGPIKENTNHRENLSEHSFGFAVDINAKMNPNLADMGAEEWKFVSMMVGEEVIYNSKGKGKDKPNDRRTQEALTIKQAGDKTEDADIEVAASKIRQQSDTLKGHFKDDAKLKERLRAIISRAADMKDSEGKHSLDPMLHQAAELASINKEQSHVEKDIEKIDKELKKTKSKTKKAERQLKYDEAKTRNAELKAKYDQTRRQLCDALQQIWKRTPESQPDTPPHAATPKNVEETVQLLEKAFDVFDKSRKDDGTPVNPGSALHQISVHGFMNLDTKLVMALVSHSGGNLIWLGTSNQDMHHFELKVKPIIPRAAPPVKPGT